VSAPDQFESFEKHRVFSASRVRAVTTGEGSDHVSVGDLEKAGSQCHKDKDAFTPQRSPIPTVVGCIKARNSQLYPRKLEWRDFYNEKDWLLLE